MTPPAASSAARAAPLAPRRAPLPPRPRRVSGPLRAPSREASRARVVVDGGGLVLGLLGRLEALSSHRLLDRLIRGRMWIGIVAFALLGIVTLQLGLLKLNSSIGRALETESSLQRENAALSIENSELAGGARVESQAVRLGMQLSGVGGLQFHASHARTDVPAAAAALKAPLKPAAASAEAGSSAAGESSPETTSSTGEGSKSTGEGASSEGEASSETASSPGSSEAGAAPPAEGESREAPASTTAEASTEAGGGTAAPGG